MNSKARMKAVFTGQRPDKVPFCPTIYLDHAALVSGRQFEDVIANPALYGEVLAGAAATYKTDAARFIMGPEASWYEKKEVRKEQDKLIQYDRISGKAEGYFDIEGGGGFIPYNEPTPVTSKSDVDAIEVITCDEYLERGNFKDTKTWIAKADEQEFFTVGLSGAQTLNFMVEKMGSTEAALLCFYDDPELALALINKGTAISLEKGKAFIKCGIDCLYIGDSYASGSVISPDIYERFCAPAYKEAAEEFHRLGVFCYKHCCGNYNPLLRSLPETGVDGMDGIDPTSGMSVKHTKEQIGDKITLMGGISCLTLLNGSPGDVYEEARQCIEAGKPGGGYVLGSACAVPKLSPFENLHTVFQAREDFGVY